MSASPIAAGSSLRGDRWLAERVAATGLMARQSTGLCAAQATTAKTAKMTMAGRQNDLSRDHVWLDIGIESVARREKPCQQQDALPSDCGK
jgi:hypothetical protein